MTLRRLTGYVVALAVVLIWLHSLGMRLSYMNQIPVFDADVTTAIANMWARMWWDEGPLKMWFSTPFAPRSIEAPERLLYESWPPGPFVPIYLTAQLLGVEPSVPMVNWINTCEHGLIALAAAFIAFNIALLNRLGKLASLLIAIGVSFPILLSRGPIYVFSQIYDYTNAVLIYTAIFILLETHFYCSQSQRKKRIIGVLQLVTIFLAFFVDWLSYTLFAFWLLNRIVAGYLGVENRVTLRRLAVLVIIPVSAFSIYLFWRLFAPDATARSLGIRSSISHLAFKVMERMNLTETSQISGSAFGRAFVGELHSSYYSEHAFTLIVISALATLMLVIVCFRRARDPADRRSVFAVGSVLMLVSVPFYLHMLLLYQHTFIHRWALMKAIFAYGLIPFALLPICVFILVRQVVPKKALPQRGVAVTGMVLAVCALFCSSNLALEHPYPLGRVDRKTYLMWDDIGRNTRYEDVVVSPIFEALPFSPQLGTSNKLVHLTKNFTEVDKLVEKICGTFNVVVALPESGERGEFASRQPSELIDTGRIQLLRYVSYPGKAAGCS
jgi:hypothetical protein